MGELRLLCKRRRPNELCYCTAVNCRFQVDGEFVEMETLKLIVDDKGYTRRDSNNGPPGHRPLIDRKPVEA